MQRIDLKTKLKVQKEKKKKKKVEMKVSFEIEDWTTFMHIAHPKLQKELVVHFILILFHILYFHSEATFLGTKPS
jgi:hypothetical protein